jgi:hypothetical protein
MASIARYKDSKYLIAIFRDAQGRQHRRTTRETTRKRALAVAQQFERAAKGGGSASRVRSTFAEFFREHYLEDLQQQSSVRSYIEQFLDSRKNETSARSREVYRLSLEKFLEFLGARADRALDELTRQAAVKTTLRWAGPSESTSAPSEVIPGSVLSPFSGGLRRQRSRTTPHKKSHILNNLAWIDSLPF